MTPITLFMPGDQVRSPNRRHAIVEEAIQTVEGRPTDVVEVAFTDAPGRHWPAFERYHPSHLVPICACCGEDAPRVRRVEDELLCTDCWQEQLCEADLVRS